jgi:hypothetical protein
MTSGLVRLVASSTVAAAIIGFVVGNSSQPANAAPGERQTSQVVVTNSDANAVPVRGSVALSSTSNFVRVLSAGDGFQRDVEQISPDAYQLTMPLTMPPGAHEIQHVNVVVQVPPGQGVAVVLDVVDGQGNNIRRYLDMRPQTPWSTSFVQHVANQPLLLFVPADARAVRFLINTDESATGGIAALASIAGRTIS